MKGVALSKERFQFIFKNDHDLEDILSRGVHTFNQWSLVVDRWVEALPPNYMQSILVWVQIRNIPVNHSTVEAITALGEFAGQVVEVAFNPEKARNRYFVRVRVRFDVSKPLRRSKVVNLQSGEVVTILYDYERIQKRCYTCQRLTHEQEKCPIFQKRMQEDKRQDPMVKKSLFGSRNMVLKTSDPLFGVLSKDQVGYNQMIGRVRINPEVLEEMRNYILAGKEEERIIREERVKKSVKELENHPLAQKSLLRLEPVSKVSGDIDKGKRIVFDFEAKERDRQKIAGGSEGQKILSSAIKSGMAMRLKPGEFGTLYEGAVTNFQGDATYALDDFMGI